MGYGGEVGFLRGFIYGEKSFQPHSIEQNQTPCFQGPFKADKNKVGVKICMSLCCDNSSGLSTGANVLAKMFKDKPHFFIIYKACVWYWFSGNASRCTKSIIYLIKILSTNRLRHSSVRFNISLNMKHSKETYSVSAFDMFGTNLTPYGCRYHISPIYIQDNNATFKVSAIKQFYRLNATVNKSLIEADQQQ